MNTCSKCGALVDSGPEIRFCHNCGNELYQDSSVITEKTANKPTNKKKGYVAVTVIIALLIILMTFIIPMMPNNGNVNQQIQTVEDILYKSKMNIINDYNDVEIESNNLLYLDGDFADMTGSYRICLLDDGTVWRIIFEPDSTSKDADMVVDAINSCLGTYEEYDYEWEKYRWVTDELELMYYVNERIYFDPM